MAPRAERPAPPYQQIAAHYRQAIRDGELSAGDKLPTSTDLATEWGVANTTVAKGLRLLASEGYVSVSNQGVTVTYGQTNTYTPRDRLNAMRRTGRIYPPSDRAAITSAELVPAPEHVADAMGIDSGKPVIRRERLTYHADRAVQHSISWMPGDLAELVPALLSTERIAGGTMGAVREATGREVKRDTYRHSARLATVGEVAALGLPEGGPHAVLAGDNTWYDAAGAVLEYGESIIPPGLWVTVDG
jgi:DNA-binding GntR family transcriptional regulator